MKRIIEALLFVSETPLSVARLAGLLETKDRAQVRQMLIELIDEYEATQRGFCLDEVAGGFRFRTRPEMAPWLRKLGRQQESRLSPAGLETLAIVAYKQPVLRAEVERIRGVDSGGVLRMLMEKDLVRVVGRQDLPGRPLIYGTTKRFLEIFGLADLKDLPTMEEMESMMGEGAPVPAKEAEPAQGQLDLSGDNYRSALESSLDDDGYLELEDFGSPDQTDGEYQSPEAGQEVSPEDNGEPAEDEPVEQADEGHESGIGVAGQEALPEEESAEAEPAEGGQELRPDAGEESGKEAPVAAMDEVPGDEPADPEQPQPLEEGEPGEVVAEDGLEVALDAGGEPGEQASVTAMDESFGDEPAEPGEPQPLREDEPAGADSPTLEETGPTDQKTPAGGDETLQIVGEQKGPDPEQDPPPDDEPTDPEPKAA